MGIERVINNLSGCTAVLVWAALETQDQLRQVLMMVLIQRRTANILPSGGDKKHIQLRLTHTNRCFHGQ